MPDSILRTLCKRFYRRNVKTAVNQRQSQIIWFEITYVSDVTNYLVTNQVTV